MGEGRYAYNNPIPPVPQKNQNRWWGTAAGKAWAANHCKAQTIPGHKDYAAYRRGIDYRSLDNRRNLELWHLDQGETIFYSCYEHGGPIRMLMARINSALNGVRAKYPGRKLHVRIHQIGNGVIAYREFDDGREVETLQTRWNIE